LEVRKVYIETKDIRLDQFLKWAGLTSTGGEAKKLVREGNILVNGELVNQRGRKIISGDMVEVKSRGRFQVFSSS